MDRLNVASDDICTTEIDSSDLTPEMRKAAENAAMREGNTIEMNRKIAFKELSILARTASPDSARVRAYEILCTKFADILDVSDAAEEDSLKVHFTDGTIRDTPKSLPPPASPELFRLQEG